MCGNQKKELSGFLKSQDGLPFWELGVVKCHTTLDKRANGK
jgi:hypothetical protein